MFSFDPSENIRKQKIFCGKGKFPKKTKNIQVLKSRHQYRIFSKKQRISNNLPTNGILNNIGASPTISAASKKLQISPSLNETCSKLKMNTLERSTKNRFSENFK